MLYQLKAKLITMCHSLNNSKIETAFMEPIVFHTLSPPQLLLQILKLEKGANTPIFSLLIGLSNFKTYYLFSS